MKGKGGLSALFAALLLACLFACSCTKSGGFHLRPYLLYEGSSSSMTLLWQGGGGRATLSWGTDATCAGGSAVVAGIGEDQRYRYTLSGLKAGEKYHYRVSLAGQTATGSFVAAPGEGESASLFIYGDSRTDTEVHDRVAGAMVAAYGAEPAMQGIALHSGDLVSSGDSRQSWERELFNPSLANLGRFLAEIPLLATIGNHEQSGRLFAAYFPYPFKSGRYWSFDYGPVHVALLDQYLLPQGELGAGQIAWLQADLAQTGRPWKIILMHEPGWSAGGHGNSTHVQQKVQPLAKKHGALVVSGHNHFYARAVVEGVNHITTGGGGAPLYDPDPAMPGVVAAEKSHHYCTLRATPKTLEFRAVRLDGSVIDSLTLQR